VDTSERPERPGRRHRARLGLLRRRAAAASALGFAAFLGLAAQHAVGSKSAAKTASSPPASAPATYFDERAGGYAFDDGSAAPLSPPVAQTNVS
jgi:hypothetical protein